MILVAASHAREKKLDFGDGNVALIHADTLPQYLNSKRKQHLQNIIKVS